MSINRAPFNALVDDDGTNTTGSVWNKTAIKDVLLDPIDAAIVAPGGEPAHTGDVTNPAGSLVLTIGAGKVTNAMLAGSIATSKIVPSVVVLTDGATVPLDVGSRASVYQLTANGDRTIAAPSNAVDGQKIIIQHVANSAPRTLTLAGGAGGFRFGTDIPALTPTAAGKTDYIGAICNFGASRWDVVAVAKGF